VWMLRAWVCTWSSEWVTLSDRYQHSPLPPRFTCRGEFSSTLNPEQPTGPPPPTLLHSLDLTRKLTFLGSSTVCTVRAGLSWGLIVARGHMLTVRCPSWPPHPQAFVTSQRGKCGTQPSHEAPNNHRHGASENRQRLEAVQGQRRHRR
jgi:hypothetical protein